MMRMIKEYANFYLSTKKEKNKKKLQENEFSRLILAKKFYNFHHHHLFLFWFTLYLLMFSCHLQDSLDIFIIIKNQGKIEWEKYSYLFIYLSHPLKQSNICSIFEDIYVSLFIRYHTYSQTTNDIMHISISFEKECVRIVLVFFVE